MEIKLDIDGMTCGGCVRAVTRVLRETPGVSDAQVDLAARSATVTASADVRPETLIAAIGDAGFEAAVAR